MIFPGAQGNEVLDLQQRLLKLGYAISSAERDGWFGPSTEEALIAFQRERRLRPDRICGTQTWSELLEANHRLGDRLLYQKTPMLKGDDVAALQHRLNSLGFHSGREDGMFGRATGDAVRTFQRNVGVVVDGIFGPDTHAALERLGFHGGLSVATIREIEDLRTGRPDGSQLTIHLSVEPELDVLGLAVQRALSADGHATVVMPSDTDEIVAERANQAHLDLLLSLRQGTTGHPSILYFMGRHTRSEQGFHLARHVAHACARHSGLRDIELSGRPHPLLRQTSMPALIFELGLSSEDMGRALVHHSSEFGRLIASGIYTAFRTAAE